MEQHTKSVLNIGIIFAEGLYSIGRVSTQWEITIVRRELCIRKSKQRLNLRW